MPTSKQSLTFLLVGHLNTDDWKRCPSIHTDRSLSCGLVFTTAEFSWKIEAAGHGSDLLGEVDNVFSRLQYHLLAILSLANHCSHHAVRVGVPVHAAVPQPSRPM